MSKKIVSRLIAGAIVLAFYAWYAFAAERAFVRMGKARYLVYEASHFDLIGSRSPFYIAIYWFVFWAALFCVYELIAAGLNRVLPSGPSDETEPGTSRASPSA